MTVDQQLAQYPPHIRLRILQTAADKLERERVARERESLRQEQIRAHNRAYARTFGQELGARIAAQIIVEAQLNAARSAAIARRFPV